MTWPNAARSQQAGRIPVIGVLTGASENGTLVQPEELIERAKNAPPRPPEEERPRGGRDRGRGGRGRDRERR